MSEELNNQSIAKDKIWSNIGISNYFMFGKVMQDPELCKELLRRILPDLKIDHVEHPVIEKAISGDIDSRGVRLDVYVEDSKDVVYNIEMQMENEGHLPKRSRYYQGSIDRNMLEKGGRFKDLKKSFIIFICNFDLFKKGRHIYTFENMCKEDTSILLKDEAYKIFLNTKGKLADVSPELKAFLDYVGGTVGTKDLFIEQLSEAVEEARQNKEWRREYMTMLAKEREDIEKGRVEGRKEGILGTINILKRMNASDSIIIQNLKEEYKLTEEEALVYLRKQRSISI